jgi:hypothetical protein
MTGAEYSQKIKVILEAADDLLRHLEPVPGSRADAIERQIRNLQQSIGELPVYLSDWEVQEEDIFALEIAKEGMGEYAESVADIVDAYKAGLDERLPGNTGCATLVIAGAFAIVAATLSVVATLS